MALEFSPQIDKITEKELNISLREKIALTYSHLTNTTMHITAEERILWNGKMDILTAPVSTKLANGLMSKEDRVKLDAIEERANYYEHPASGVVPGSYLLTSVDAYGHITYGANPTTLAVTVDNSTKLGGTVASSFAQLISPAFLGTPTVPTATIGDNSSKIANTAFVLANSIKTIYTASATAPTDKTIFWINTTTNTLNYWNGSAWASIGAVYSA